MYMTQTMKQFERACYSCCLVLTVFYKILDDNIEWQNYFGGWIEKNADRSSRGVC